MEKEYHLIREIREQPDAIRNSLAAEDLGLRRLAQGLAGSVERIILPGCGAPYMLSLAAVYPFERWAGTPAEAIEAAEFAMYRAGLVDKRALLALITSSGKTVKVIDAARLGARKGTPMFALTNLVPSPITEELDQVIQTRSGWSDSFPTKQTTSALALLNGLALHWAQVKGTLPAEFIQARRAELYEGIPAAVQTALGLEGQMAALANKFLEARIYAFIGSGPNLATALLGAAKMKETSQSYAEACNLEEYAHLHSLSLQPGDPVFVITEAGQIGERNRLVCQHIRAHGGELIVIGPAKEKELWRDLQVTYVEVPDHDEMFGPLVNLIPLQLFAYFVATGKGRNPDRPPQHGPMDFLQKIIYTSMLEGWEDR